MRVVAHGGAPDESLALFLLFGALWVGWVGWARLRGRGFGRLPGWAGPAMLASGAGLAIAAITIPPALYPPVDPGIGPRPRSTATVAFEQPEPGTSIEDGRLEVVVDLQGGTIVGDRPAGLSPDTGHIHLTVDGRLVSMSYGVAQVVDVRALRAGEHRLSAEFVAADHFPFSPRVMTTVTFRTATAP